MDLFLIFLLFGLSLLGCDSSMKNSIVGSNSVRSRTSSSAGDGNVGAGSEGDPKEPSVEEIFGDVRILKHKMYAEQSEEFVNLNEYLGQKKGKKPVERKPIEDNKAKYADILFETTVTDAAGNKQRKTDFSVRLINIPARSVLLRTLPTLLGDFQETLRGKVARVPESIHLEESNEEQQPETSLGTISLVWDIQKTTMDSKYHGFQDLVLQGFGSSIWKNLQVKPSTHLKGWNLGLPKFTDFRNVYITYTGLHSRKPTKNQKKNAKPESIVINSDHADMATPRS
eukprot:Platyproteum_vivax@DN2826_c0_g1_i3.p1